MSVQKMRWILQEVERENGRAAAPDCRPAEKLLECNQIRFGSAPAGLVFRARFIVQGHSRYAIKEYRE